MLSEKRLKKGLYWEKAWYLVNGCSEVDTSCDNCWARSYTERFNKYRNLFIKDNRWTGKVYFKFERLNIVETHIPTVYSVWNDILHESIALQDAARVLHKAINNKQHIYLFLTKRPHRINSLINTFKKIYSDHDSISSWNTSTSHLWFGTSIYGNDDICRYRIQELYNVSDIKNKFISAEPMLTRAPMLNEKISLVIAGCESGINKRPVEMSVLDDLISQCKVCDISLFVKQWIINGKFTKVPFKEFSTLPY